MTGSREYLLSLEVFFTPSLFGISLLYWGVVGGVFRQSCILGFRFQVHLDLILSFWCNNITKFSNVIIKLNMIVKFLSAELVDACGEKIMQ